MSLDEKLRSIRNLSEEACRCVVIFKSDLIFCLEIPLDSDGNVVLQQQWEDIIQKVYAFFMFFFFKTH